MTTTRRTLFLGLALTVMALGTGCSSTPDPTPVSVMMNADAGINPNENGDPSPIVVRVYELKGVKAFNNASFFDFDDEAKTLGATLVASREYELTPGSDKTYDAKISSEATHLGVVAGFRNIQTAQWQDSVELKQEKKNKFIIYLTSQAVRIQKVEKKFLGVF